MLTHTDNSFDKVNDFLKQNLLYSQNAFIKQMPYGFKVNGYSIRKENDVWSLYDRSNTLIHSFYRRKHAILAAVISIKNQQVKLTSLCNLDSSWDTFICDREVYTNLLKKNPYKYLYQDRLDRIEQGLESIRSQIRQLEKSFNLQ